MSNRCLPAPFGGRCRFNAMAKSHRLSPNATFQELTRYSRHFRKEDLCTNPVNFSHAGLSCRCLGPLTVQVLTQKKKHEPQRDVGMKYLVFAGFCLAVAGCGVHVEPSKTQSEQEIELDLAVRQAASVGRSVVAQKGFTRPQMEAVRSVASSFPEACYQADTSLSCLSIQEVFINDGRKSVEGYTLVGISEFKGGERCFVDALADKKSETQRYFEYISLQVLSPDVDGSSKILTTRSNLEPTIANIHELAAPSSIEAVCRAKR